MRSSLFALLSATYFIFNTPLLAADQIQADLLTAARSKYDLGDYKKTVKDCTAWLEQNHDDSEVRRLRGKAYLAEGELDKAIEDFSKAGVAPGPLEEAQQNQSHLNLNDDDELDYPDWLEALVIMYVARISAEQGQFERSLKLCDLALRKAAVFPELLALKANILIKENRLYEAEELYRQAVSYRPQDWHMWMGYSQVLDKQVKLTQALNAVERTMILIKSPPYQEPELDKRMDFLNREREYLQTKLRR
ncbi:MAG: tetratricopeptide repeat protein [Candidatus Obscuribacterales bacterium]|nr:tetratricopeptide repeat protein [Candidatus Obscuribacterales bacterium]